MKRVIFLVFLAAGLLTPAALAGDSKVQRWAEIFDAESRKEWQKPLTVIDFVGIRPGNTVADIGAGTGYFAAPISIQIGAEGKLYAVDVDQAMLDHLMQRDDVMTDRVVPIKAKKNDPLLPQGAIDVVLIVNTWHHIKKRDRYLATLASSLTPEGRVAVVDYREGELPVGPPPGEKLSREQVVGEFGAAGWRLASESVALPYQYLLVFYPPGEDRPILEN